MHGLISRTWCDIRTFENVVIVKKTLPKVFIPTTFSDDFTVLLLQQVLEPSIPQPCLLRTHGRCLCQRRTGTAVTRKRRTNFDILKKSKGFAIEMLWIRCDHLYCPSVRPSILRPLFVNGVEWNGMERALALAPVPCSVLLAPCSVLGTRGCVPAWIGAGLPFPWVFISCRLSPLCLSATCAAACTGLSSEGERRLRS